MLAHFLFIEGGSKTLASFEVCGGRGTEGKAAGMWDYCIVTQGDRYWPVTSFPCLSKIAAIEQGLGL